MNENSHEKLISPENILQVKNILALFITALKNYALYPENHSISQKSIINAKESLDGYLTHHEFLRLYVEENKLLFQSNLVHQEKPEEQVLVYPLFRDGIQWIEFQNGLTAEELKTILSLINKYRIIKEEAEDDLVTTMWEADFSHLQYQVDDEVWTSDPIIDISGLKAGHGLGQEATEIFADPFIQLKKFNLSMPESDFLKLSLTDENQIRAMIREEEMRNSTQDCLDVLAIILREQHTVEDCQSVIDFLLGEIQFALSQCEFSYVHSFFQTIKALSESPAPDKPWFKNLLMDFWHRIASPEVLDVLASAWPQVNTINDSQMADFRESLLMLPPESIHALTTLMSKITYPRIESTLIEVIAVQASKGSIDVKKLINSIKPSLVRDFMVLLNSLDIQDINKILLDLTKHSSFEIRECAINILVDRDPENIRPLFPLIEDHHQNIRHLLFKHLGKQRNQLCEQLLMNYLNKNQIKTNNREHIIDCYRTFGRCATVASIPFLRNILLKRDWKAFVAIVANPHRQGAALALMLMHKEWGTEEILKRANRSIFNGIRLAHSMAEKEIIRMKRKGIKS